MKKNTILLACMVLGVFALTGTAQGGYVYAYNGGDVLRLDGDLTNQVVYNKGYGGFLDMAASSDALYFADGTNLRRTELNGDNLTTVLGIGVDIVAVNGGDGYVYSYNGSSILRHDADLTNQVVYDKGYGGFTDMAASSDALYFVNGDTLYRTDLNGDNLTSVAGIGVELVAVNGDGYVYTYNSGDNILRHDADLGNQVVYVKGYGGFVDMAASVDGYLYFANGSNLLRTDLNGDNLVTGIQGNGADIVGAPVPEPATMALLLMGSVAVLARRKK